MKDKSKLAVEVIFDSKNNILGYLQIDPNSIEKQYEKNGEWNWVQYPKDKINSRVLGKHQILTNF